MALPLTADQAPQPMPTQQPTQQSTPQVDLSDSLVPRPQAAQAPGNQTTSGNQPIDLSDSLVPRESSSTPPSPFDKIKKGLAQGFADGSGLTAPGDDPEKLGWGDIAGQTWSNLKKSAIHSYENLGGKEIQGEPVPGTTLQAGKNLLAMAGTPFDMIGTGINSMATTIENGSTQLVAGIKSGDHQAAARGAGQILASLGQIAVGMEGKAAGDLVAGKVGEVAEKAAAKPGAGLLRATSEKSYLYGKNPGRVFIDEPIKPTLSIENLQTQIANAGKNLDQQVRSELVHPAVASKTIDAGAVIENTIQRELQDLTKESGLKDRQNVIDAIKKVKDDTLNTHDADGNVIGDKRGPRTLAEVNEMKKSIGRNTRWTGDPELEQYVNSARKAMYGSLNDAIENTVQQAKPGTSIKALNARYSNVIEASRLIEKRLAQEESGGFLGLGLRRAMAHGEWLAALGLLTHGEPLLGSLALADRALRSTPGRIATAQTLAGVGRGLQSAAESGLAGKAAVGAVAAGNSGKWVHIQTSDDKHWEIHPDDLEKAKQRDPNLKVIQDENEN